MQPTFTHVPPRPHLLFWGDGFMKSHKPTFNEGFVSFALLAQERPPEPPPITYKSNSSYSISIFIKIIKLEYLQKNMI
jgi:hypothetical protein